MNPYAQFMVDKDLEVQGKWIEYADFRVKIARSGGRNSDYLKELTKIGKKHKNITKLPEHLQNKLLRDVFIKTIIKDWGVAVDKNEENGKITYEDGKIAIINNETGDIEVVPFSDTALDNLLSKLPDLFEDIRDQANNISNFQNDVEDETVKN